jgi:succinate-acetate transporter protein
MTQRDYIHNAKFVNSDVGAFHPKPIPDKLLLYERLPCLRFAFSSFFLMLTRIDLPVILQLQPWNCMTTCHCSQLKDSYILGKGAAMTRENGTLVQVKDTLANPAPLGLLGFGMTTVLLNLHNTGLYTMDSMILGMGIFYGGLAQIIAGIMEWKKGNTFGTTAFTSYGLFWLSLVALIVIPNLGLSEPPAPSAMAAYMMMWGIFTAVMFVGTLRLNRALQFVFLSLAILFFLLALSDILGSTTVRSIAGYEGIICGLSAVYAGLAQVLNEIYGKVVLPICPMK